MNFNGCVLILWQFETKEITICKRVVDLVVFFETRIPPNTDWYEKKYQHATTKHE